jgi:hypothetical protein
MGRGRMASPYIPLQLFFCLPQHIAIATQRPKLLLARLDLEKSSQLASMGKAKGTGSSSGIATLKKKAGAWENSTCSIRDLKTLRNAGLLSESDEKVRLPDNEVTPCPDTG